jgi:hypothetical protein
VTIVRRASIGAATIALSLLLQRAGSAIGRDGLRAADSDLDALVARVSAGVEAFGRDFAGIVAEEDYAQVVRPWISPPQEPSEVAGLLSRRVRSDVLMTHARDTPWAMHRDVFEVDGRPVRDRAARLERIFLSPASTDVEQLRRIAFESARYNLGDVQRTINLPTFGLLVAHPAYLARFRFEAGAETTLDRQALAVVRFRETRRPTLVRDHGDNVPLRGELWIEAGTGTIVRTLLEPQHRAIRSLIRTTFRHDPAVGARVPTEMWDWYSGGRSSLRDGRRIVTSRSGPLYVEGVATYSRFRRFRVTTTEDVRE